MYASVKISFITLVFSNSWNCHKLWREKKCVPSQ